MFHDLLLIVKKRKWALPCTAAPTCPCARALPWISQELPCCCHALAGKGARTPGQCFCKKCRGWENFTVQSQGHSRTGKENYKLQSAGLQPSPREAAFSISFSKQQDETLTPFQTEFEWNLLYEHLIEISPTDFPWQLGNGLQSRGGSSSNRPKMMMRMIKPYSNIYENQKNFCASNMLLL